MFTNSKSFDQFQPFIEENISFGTDEYQELCFASTGFDTTLTKPLSTKQRQSPQGGGVVQG